MTQPTRADLEAANERLGAEVAAHRVLLAAIRELATVPKPADWASVEYLCDLENRLISVFAYAGTLDDVTPDIMAQVIHNRAKSLREDAAAPVRYELAKPKAAQSALRVVPAVTS